MSSRALEAPFDVAVVGGGPAGIAAALAAAACGARCVLVDRGPVLGGNVSNAFVHTICGLYLPAEAEDAKPRLANRGFAARLAAALVAAGGAGAVERAGHVFVLPILPPVFERLAAERCAAAANLRVCAPVELVSASIGGGCELALANGERLRARVAIDASGDGNLAALAGAECERAAGATLQNASYILRLRGVDASQLVGFARLKLSVAIARAARAGSLPSGADSVLARPGATPDEAYLTVNVPKPETGEFDPIDPAQRRALEGAARERAEAIVAFLREERPGFEGAEVSAWPQRIGVREGRRVRGRTRVEADDVLEGRRRDDEVALSSWPIELWHGHERASFQHVRGPSSVPLGALVSATHGELGMAGRCLSASHEALGALRVIGTALASGEAIGVASALAADAGCALTAIDAERVRERRDTLDEAGA